MKRNIQAKKVELLEGNKVQVLEGSKVLEVIEIEKGDNLLECMNKIKKDHGILLESYGPSDINDIVIEAVGDAVWSGNIVGYRGLEETLQNEGIESGSIDPDIIKRLEKIADYLKRY